MPPGAALAAVLEATAALCGAADQGDHSSAARVKELASAILAAHRSANTTAQPLRLPSNITENAQQQQDAVAALEAASDRLWVSGGRGEKPGARARERGAMYGA